MAVFDRTAPVLPEVPSHRATAIAGSVLGHAALIGLLVVAGRHAVEEAPTEPVRMVFVEPAPPPKLGAPDGGARAAPQPQADPAAPEPPASVLEWVAEPALFPPRPVPKPEPHPQPVAKPHPQPKAAPAPVQARNDVPASAGPAIAGATSSEPRGVADGVAAGVEGGLPGGQVGGLGSAITPVKQAAVAPTIVHRVVPAYPESARLRGIEGQVVLEAVIARDGSVEPGVKVVQSIPALDRAAIAAFERWRFTPGRDASGKPLRVILQAPVRFVLR